MLTKKAKKGIKEPQSIQCTNCGSVCNKEDNFCWKCGKKLETT